jgi:hypothetical protein
MKRWRVVHFTTVEEAETYLNGLSLQPDQIKGLFAKTPTTVDGTGGMVLVCWLNAQQQRIEELQQRPLTDDDNITHLDPNQVELWAPDADTPPEGRRASRRRGEDEEVSP